MLLQLKDISANPISINIKNIVLIFCDSEIILSTGDRIKIDMAYEELIKLIQQCTEGKE